MRQDRKFEEFYQSDVTKNPLFEKIDKNLLRTVSKEAYSEARSFDIFLRILRQKF